MTAKSKDAARNDRRFRDVDLTLAAGTIAYLGARLAWNGAGKVVPATSAANLVPVGTCMRKVDASGGDKTVSVDIGRELHGEWFANDTAGNAVTASDVGNVCWMLDDDTVTITPGNRAIAGRVWKVSTKGVLVERLQSLVRTPLPQPAPIAFVAADYVLTAAAIVQDGVYDLPATAAASTVTLPANAPDGTRVSFTADGVKNGHTIQYRDATGPTAITAALVASKRHLVVCQKQSGKWFATSSVSP